MRRDELGVIPPGVKHRFVVIRHAEPEVEIRGRVYGKLDVGLSERGRRQGHRLGVALRDLKVPRVYVSPRRRARETAEFLPTTIFEVVEGLAEMDFGEIEGKTYEDVEAQYPDFYARWMQDPTGVIFPGGEGFRELSARVNQASDSIAANATEPLIVIVAHGGVNRCILARALGLDAKQIFCLGQDYAGISVIDDYGSSRVLRALNLCF